uniref:Uncharacterized protein n=1 Tax=Ciona intestinalis TaxID=7719 RepID=H2XJV3_CIOIN
MFYSNSYCCSRLHFFYKYCFKVYINCKCVIYYNYSLRVDYLNRLQYTLN